MPRSPRSPGDSCDPPRDVAHVPREIRPRRIIQRGRNICRMAEEPLSNTSDAVLLPIRISVPAPGLTQCMLGCMCTYTLKGHLGHQHGPGCRLNSGGLPLRCFWVFSMHLPSKLEVWQVSISCSHSFLIRMYQEKVRHHTGEIQDLRGNINQLIAKLQEMEAMSDEQKMAQKIMKMIQGDYIEKPDFALKSIGATIDFEQTSATYNHDKARSYWNWIRLWNYAQPPDVILEPNVTPGNCWAFAGDRGQVTIRLAQKVYLSNLTLQHIPKTISLSGSLDTAPKDFVIYGMEGSPREEVFLGAFQFQPENIIQMFQLQNQPPRTFGAVKVKISSNWGNPRFTCLYRVRVHGSVTPPREQPHQTPTHPKRD
uniref:Sad1 and UNC84 domain containing 5 n=1 Tax=Sus scrofa TaxID=9823 RepID=A0A8D0SK08_PIG